MGQQSQYILRSAYPSKDIPAATIAAGRLRVNRDRVEPTADPAMPAMPIATDFCGAAKYRDVPSADTPKRKASNAAASALQTNASSGSYRKLKRSSAGNTYLHPMLRRAESRHGASNADQVGALCSGIVDASVHYGRCPKKLFMLNDTPGKFRDPSET
jgi:hypothetical protein